MSEKKTVFIILVVYAVVIGAIGAIGGVVYKFYTPQNQNIPNLNETQADLMKVQMNMSKDNTAMYLTFLIVFILIVSVVITYLVNKILNFEKNVDIKIDKIVPEKGKVGGDISIYGSNFGEKKDIVWFDDIRISDSTPPNDKNQDHHLVWHNSGKRIDIHLPPNIKQDKYKVRVANNRFLTEPYEYEIGK